MSLLPVTKNSMHFVDAMDLDVNDDLKPQQKPSATQDGFSKARNPATDVMMRGTGDSAMVEVIKDDESRGCRAQWQRTETIDDFLTRLPIASPATAEVGPWLWVHDQKLSFDRKAHCERADKERFYVRGTDLLHSFRKQQSSIEAQNADKAPATITRKLGPYRDQLQSGLLNAAVETGTTVGKWMLFPSTKEVPQCWRKVAVATSQSKLGSGAKVATDGANKESTLICVYTYNFADLEDVRRVLYQLLDLGLYSRDGKPIYYKCDAYTYLDISSDNLYKLRASLFSSREILEKEAKAGSPLAWLRQR